MSSPAIILCRHGRPALSRNVLLSWRDYEAWWVDYDLSGLRADQTVPPAITHMAETADLLVSSPLPRAMESVRLAAGREPDVVVPELVEAPLPPPHLPLARMRPISWGTVSRVCWLAGNARDGETAREAGVRAGEAARQLEALTEPDRTVFVTAHGWFNRMVGIRLRRRGWRCVSGRGDAYWSFRRFERV